MLDRILNTLIVINWPDKIQFFYILHAIEINSASTKHRWWSSFAKIDAWWGPKYTFVMLPQLLCVFNSFMTESLSYRNQCIDLQSQSMDWFLYDRNVCHERVKKYYTWNHVLKILERWNFAINFLLKNLVQGDFMVSLSRMKHEIITLWELTDWQMKAYWF